MKSLGAAVGALALILLVAATSGCGGKKSSTTGPVETPCSLSESSVDFGAVWVGQSTNRTLVLTNTGSGTLEGTLSSAQSEFAVVEAAA